MKAPNTSAAPPSLLFLEEKGWDQGAEYGTLAPNHPVLARPAPTDHEHSGKPSQRIPVPQAIQNHHCAKGFALNMSLPPCLGSDPLKEGAPLVP